MKKVSVLVPCYNEEGNVIPMSKAIIEVFERDLPEYDYEIVYIENCSQFCWPVIFRTLLI
jgi:glycosyltransferase involved in cell wall biosynthesis